MSIKEILIKIIRRYTIFHFLNLLLFVVCVIFSIVDISAQIDQYYRYEVIVNTKLDFEPEIYLPSVSICSPTIINREQLKIRYPEVYKTIVEFNKKKNDSWQDYEWRKLLADSLTIGQLRLIQSNFKSLFISCMFRTNEDKFVDCDRFVPIQNHFSLNHNCYILFEQNVNEVSSRYDQFNFNHEQPFDYNVINRTERPHVWRKRTQLLTDPKLYDQYFKYKHQEIKNKDWIRILINKTYLWNGWIDFGISHKGRFYEMYHGQPNFMCISTDVVASVEITFSYQNIFRLPAPYESNCLNYSKLNYRDRAHFVESCYANLTIQNINRFPFLLETSDYRFPNLDNYHFASNSTESNHTDYYTKCSDEQDRPNCNYTQYEVKLNQINFCQRNMNLSPGIDDYLMKNLTEALNAETVDNPNLQDQILKDHKKNQILMLQQKKFMESNSCKLKRFLIVVQFNSDYTTELDYAKLFQFWDLVSNIGQSISVYLGLCVFDLHKLFETLFEWFSVSEEEEADLNRTKFKPREDRLSRVLDDNIGRRLSRKLSNIRFDLDKTSHRSSIRNGSSRKIGKKRDKKQFLDNKLISKVNDLNQFNSLTEKIKKFESIQDQFNELKRNYNLQSNKNGLLSRYNYSKQLNNQLTPVNWNLSKSLNDDLKTKNSILFGNQIDLHNDHLYKDLLKNYPIQQQNQSALLSIIENKKLNDNKSINNVQESTNPSLIYVDDYLYKVINLHKKNDLTKDSS